MAVQRGLWLLRYLVAQGHVFSEIGQFWADMHQRVTEGDRG